ncbi:Gfo/Idh/MocA family protein [Leptospira interrogans]
MAPARIAIVGAGQIGRRHVEAMRGNPDRHVLAAIADPSPAAKSLARELGVPFYANEEQLLAREKPDGVIVATPNQHHASVGLACIDRKIPILVEKPIADSVRDALKLVDAAERANVPVLVGHHRRHNPIMQKAAEVIRSGGIGKVIAAAGLWMSHKPTDYFNITWRKEPGGGPILINAIHDVDCMRMLCGDVDVVQASTASTARPHPVEDTAAAVLTFANGALGTLMISDAVSAPWSWEWTSRENPWYPNEPENCYMVSGTLGSITVPTLQHRTHEAGKQTWADPMTERRIHYRPADPYVEQMRNFVAVIRGEAEPIVSGSEGARTLATTLAISESAKTQQPVRISDYLEQSRG